MATSFPDVVATEYPCRAMLTKEQLQRLYVKNKFELTKHVSAGARAEAKYFGGDDWFIRWYDAPMGAEVHNGLEHQDIPDERVPAALDAVLHHFEGRRFSWVTGPQDQSRLEHFLQRNDLLVDETAPIMAADLRQRFELLGLTTPTGITMADVDYSRVRDWVAAWAAQAPKADILHWTRIYTSMARSLHRNQFRMFMAAKDGRPIGTGYLHCFSGVAAIHAIVVAPDLRRQGIGKALVAYGMQVAHSMGYNTATLTATNLTAPLFRSLGFREFGTVKLYVWRPLKDPRRQEKGRTNKAEEIEEAEDDGWCLV